MFWKGFWDDCTTESVLIIINTLWTLIFCLYDMRVIFFFDNMAQNHIGGVLSGMQSKSEPTWQSLICLVVCHKVEFNRVRRNVNGGKAWGDRTECKRRPSFILYIPSVGDQNCETLLHTKLHFDWMELTSKWGLCSIASLPYNATCCLFLQAAWCQNLGLCSSRSIKEVS